MRAWLLCGRLATIVNIGELHMKMIVAILVLILISFTLMACGDKASAESTFPSDYDYQAYKMNTSGEPSPSIAVNWLLQTENQVEISDHLREVIFNAGFLDIPTYENSGQTAHPQVLFFEEKFMGFHYIMVMTPYPYSDDTHENPSILGSQDGVIWEVPEGGINPVVGVPIDVQYGGYYSDPFILRRGDMLELWFRHTLAAAPGNSHNRIYRTTSSDLSNWGELETILECADYTEHFMSPVVMHDGFKYRLWYANFYSHLFYIESVDLMAWSEKVRVRADLNGLGIWHHDIVFTGERYEALFTSADWGNHPVFRLFYAVSYDGIDFGTGSEMSIQRISPELEAMTVHKCTFVKIDGIYQMYIAVFDQDSVWRLFYFEIAEENLFKLFDCIVDPLEKQGAFAVFLVPYFVTNVVNLHQLLFESMVDFLKCQK